MIFQPIVNMNYPNCKHVIDTAPVLLIIRGKRQKIVKRTNTPWVVVDEKNYYRLVEPIPVLIVEEV